MNTEIKNAVYAIVIIITISTIFALVNINAI